MLIHLPVLDAQSASDPQRPRTRGDCMTGGKNAARPCPWVTCRYHLYEEMLPRHPGLEVEKMTQSCALDIADQGGVTLEEIGDMLGLTRERVRQIEADAIRKLEKRPGIAPWRPVR